MSVTDEIEARAGATGARHTAESFLTALRRPESGPAPQSRKYLVWRRNARQLKRSAQRLRAILDAPTAQRPRLVQAAVLPSRNDLLAETGHVLARSRRKHISSANECSLEGVAVPTSRRRWTVALLTSALAVAPLVALPAPAALAAAQTVLEGFEGPSSEWTRASGAPTVTASAALTEGSSSLTMAYDLLAGTAEVQRSLATSPVVVAPASSLTLDLKGDGTYNTAYLKLRDATGEMFLYRLDAMRSSTVYPVTVDLRKPAASASGGNADGVLDAPMVFSRLLVVRNGSQPAVGRVTVDNLRLTPTGWTLPQAETAYFAPSKGESTTFAFTAESAGDYSLTLKDKEGRAHTLSGSAGAGGVSIPWDGLDDKGTAMTGDVRGVFQHDSTADGTIDLLRSQTGIPLLVTVAAADPTSGLTALVEGFESGTSGWSTVAGTGSLSSTTTKTEGASALRLDYDLRTSELEVAEVPSARVADSPIAAMAVDFKGDSSFNTLYLKLRDASGEDFTYRLDALRSSTWSSVKLDLTRPPVASSGGNADGVLDLPLALRGFSVIRNGSQPAVGSVLIDNVRAVTTGWTMPSTATAFFTPGTGSALGIGFDAATAGDYSLTLRTADGLSRTITGTASAPGPQTLDWNGRSDDDQPMKGDVTGVFSHDSTPDGALATTGTTRSGLPLVTTLADATSGGTIVESFDANNDRWLSTGTGGVAATSSGDGTEGAGSLSLSYDLSGGNASIESKGTPLVIADSPVSSLALDLRGDASYNSVFLVLEDATGEVFQYRTDALRLSRWATVSIDLTRPPAASRHGNMDGLLDYPLSLLGVSVARNGATAPVKGTVLLDNLRSIEQGWSLPAAEAHRFAASTGQSTTVSFKAGAPGDWTLTLADLSGRTRLIRGTAAVSGTVSTEFDGKDDAGTTMAGVVKAQLRYDTSADGALAATPVVAVDPYATGVTARPPETDQRSIAGVNAFLTALDDPAKADRQAALMEDAFLRDDREEFEWKRVEPRNGFYDWAKFDQAVAVTQARNVEIIGKLGYTAPWASSAPAGTAASDVEYYPPSNISDFTEYAAAVVERYKDRVHVWEVWNEPNTALYWKPGPDGLAYGALLKATYAAIKAVDPSATVLVGGTAGFDPSFMKKIENAGAGGSYDGLAIHTYSKGAPTTGQAETWLDGAASYLAKTAPARSLWITEVGWPTCTQCDGATSEVDQARYLSHTYLDAASRGVKSVAWYNLVGGDNPAARLDTFALTTKDGRKKPSYEALRDIGAAFSDAESSGPAAVTASGTSVRAEDLAAITGFTSAGISGGSAKLSVTQSRHSGAGGFKLDYNYSGTSKGGQISTNRVLPGEPTAVSIWIYGDGSMSPIYLKLVDSTGERFQALVGNAGAPGWKKMTLFSDGLNGNSTHAGGDNDGVWDYPVKLTDVFAYKGTAGVTSGSLLLDDITVDYGVNTHGTVLFDRSGATQAVYTAEPVATELRVTGSDAFLADADGRTPTTVTDGEVSIDLGRMPVFLESAVSATTLGAGSTVPVSVSWMGGNRHQMTVQIFSASGALVQTLATGKYFDAGRSTITWDGRRADGGTARAGSYTARLTLLPFVGPPILSTATFTLK